MISIIVPVYNTEQYLSRCINSILNQNFTDFELLLIDDGSKDGSGAICDAYAEEDTRVRVFHKENGGVSSARNLGLDNAKGEWVTFVDSDDCIDDGYLYVESDADLVVRNWTLASGIVKEFIDAQNVDEFHFKEFFECNCHLGIFRQVCSSFFKASILTNNGIRFDQRFRLGEDTLFAMNYYKYCNSIDILDGACYRYNQQENWEQKYRLSWVETEQYLEAFMNEYEQMHINSPALTSFIFDFFYNTIDEREKGVRRKWALSNPVLRYKKTQLSNRGLKYRIKYYLSIVLSTFV